MKTLLFIIALSFNIFLCLYPGHKFPDVSPDTKIVRTTITSRPERPSFNYSDLLKNKASELSQK